MGKRKSSQKAPPKQKGPPLATSFKCLFCHHDKAVTVKMDKQSMFGHLSCKVCGQKYTAPINNLSAAVDIYCDWVDACEEVRLKQPKQQRPKSGPDPLSHGAQGGAVISGISRRDDEDAEGEDDVDDADDYPTSRRQAADDEDEDEDQDDRPKRRRVDSDDEDEDDD